ncbi:MAG: FKBP-type peptidyl-prolyl cis-trans isomerase [Muribaculaceae bacterium]
MKKIIFGLAAVAMLAMGSCSKEQTATTGSNPLTDTISTTFGQYVGANLAMQCADFTPEQKVEFLRALQSTLTTPSGEAAERGTMVGAQMLQTVQQFASHDQIEINRTAMLDGFKEVFNMDSVDYTTVMKYSNDFQTARQSYLEQAQQARAAEAAGSPEAIQNGRIAADYINNLKAQDSSVQTSTSGLVFKIENPGQGEKPNANSTVAVKYPGRHLNGETFDASGDTPATFNLNGVVPGFREGLMQIAKGGKATLYIPGNLAYGPEGMPQAGIGPNEMLVFDVELVDINE